MTGALCIILGRAGSKGVAGKNARPVAGRPCIAWTIDHARSARAVGAIAVSTDGEQIAQAAREAGAEVLARSEHTAHDRATVDDAAREALDAWESRHGALADAHPVVILYANVPVRPPGLIDRALDLLRATGCHSVQSYAPVGKHHPWWTVRVGEDGALRPWEGDVLFHNCFRRQDLPPAHVPDGGVIALQKRALTLQLPGVAPGPHAFFGSDRRAIISPEGSVVDIDSEIDLLVADALLRQRP